MAEEKQKKTGEEEKEKNAVPQNSIARMYLNEEERKEEKKEHKKSLVDMTAKEKRLLEKEKIKEMSFKKRMEYFFMYYKWVPILIIGVIIAAVGGYSWYEHAKIENVLSVVAVNTMTQDFTERQEEIRKTIGKEGKYDSVSILSNFATDPEGKDFEYRSQMAFMAQMQAGALDVMIMPESMYRTESKKGILENMGTVLGEDYKKFDGYENGDCVIIKDKEFIEDYGLVYGEAYICVLKNSLNQENAAKWILSLE
ncbi:MAG: hypothetical protein Q4B37_00345 [Eubacteriales bacterium]|nr:hypothetical protein [Eubacteriales bacterium]